MPAMPQKPPGKVLYKYTTLDGGPPNQGKVPRPEFPPPAYNAVFGPAPPAGPPPPSYGCFPAPPPPPEPNFTFFGPPPPPVLPAPPAFGKPAEWYSWVYGKSQPPPPPPVPQKEWVPPGKTKPVSGNRVEGEIAVFPDSGAGYLFPKKFVTFYIFKNNISTHAKQPDGNIWIGPVDKGDYTKQRAACTMTIEELLDALDCYDPSSSWPQTEHGIVELVPHPPGYDGWFAQGSELKYGDRRGQCTVGSLWEKHISEEGQKPRVPPVWLTRTP